MRAFGILGVALVAGIAFGPGQALATHQVGSPQVAGVPQIAGVQIALRSAGLYLGPIDGEVGPITRSAIASAQTRAHLPVTGLLTTRTRDSLGPLGKPLFGKRTIAPGDFGLDVSELQFLLSRSGFYHGALDGYMGPKLLAAVRAFQVHAHLSADGIPGPETIAKLKQRTSTRRAIVHPTYIVQSGDSLTAIATRYSTTLTRLAGLNKLDPSKPLLIGAKLILPPHATSVSMTATPVAVRGQIDTWAQRLGVSVALVRALAWMESGYQPGVVSDVGAQGVMQVMPTTRSFVEEVLVGHPIPQTTDGNIEVGILYLRHLLSQFDGDTQLALGAWYQGEAAVREYGLYKMTKPFVEDVLALQSRM